MIFIGQGALLRRAVHFAISEGFRIDAVCAVGDELAALCERHAIRRYPSDVITSAWPELSALCSDGLVFSINNSRMFRGAALQDRSVRLINIHNGITPAYRGRPEVCLVYALLNAEPEYGVTLHEIDAGIDTGPVLDVIRYPITVDDDFESLMLRGIEACAEIFRRNLHPLARRELAPIHPRAATAQPTHLYRLRDLEQLSQYYASPHLQRATRWGVFTSLFPESWAIMARNLATRARLE